jgi:hypothetical protein
MIKIKPLDRCGRHNQNLFEPCKTYLWQILDIAEKKIKYSIESQKKNSIRRINASAANKINCVN